MTQPDETNSWPTFPALGDLPEQEFDEYISELNPPPEGSAFINPVEMFRRRRRLLRPPLRVARLQDDRFVYEWDVPAPSGPIDIVVTRVFAAEMPQRQFEVKIVIGAEHEFQQNRRSNVSHARVFEGSTGNLLPFSDIPFLQDLRVVRGATLNIRIVFLDGHTSKAAVGFLKSEIFRAGVKLTRSFNPVFGIAAQCLSSLTASMLSGGKNSVVTQGTFGLLNRGSALSSTLGIGDYLFAQLPSEITKQANGGALRWDPAVGRVMDGDRPLDANYLLVRIAESRSNE